MVRAFVDRSHDALAFMSQEEFRRKNADRTERLGEQKQIAWTPLDEEIVALVREREQADVAVLHPSTMYRLFAPVLVGTSADGVDSPVRGFQPDRSAVTERGAACRLHRRQVLFQRLFPQHAAEPCLRRPHDPCAWRAKGR